MTGRTGIVNSGNRSTERIRDRVNAAAAAALRGSRGALRTAAIFHLDDRVGRVREALIFDLIAVKGNPVESIVALRDVRFVMQAGQVVRHDAAAN